MKELGMDKQFKFIGNNEFGYRLIPTVGRLNGWEMEENDKIIQKCNGFLTCMDFLTNVGS